MTPHSLHVFALFLRDGRAVTARRLGMSEASVKWHAREVYGELGLIREDTPRASGSLAIEAAIRLGWLRIPEETR